MTYPEAEPETRGPAADPMFEANQAQECDENVAASSNQTLQAAVAEGAVKTHEASTPPCQVPESVAKSTVPSDRPNVSRSWLPKDMWLSPTPNGGAAAKSVPPPAATSKISAATPKPSTVLPRRSGILFTARPKNQPVLPLVAAPDPRMTSTVPAASDGRGTAGGWKNALLSQAHIQDGSNREFAPSAPTHGEHQGTGTGPAPVSILKTPRFQGRGDPGEEGGTPDLTPPPPVAHAVETHEHAARASVYETPTPHAQQRRAVPTGPAATAAAVTPGTGSAGKKSVSFDPVKLTETFVIPRTRAERGPEAAAAPKSPMQRRESGHVVPMDLEGEAGTTPPEDAFDFDGTNNAFMMSCRESIDRVKVMNDEILDLNVYLSAMQADMQMVQANMMDVADDTEALCRGYEDILELLAKEFPEDG